MPNYDWANGGSVNVFLHGEWFYFYGRMLLFYEVGMEFKDKIMLHYFREVKCQQGFTPGIWY